MSAPQEYLVEVFPPSDWAHDGTKVAARLNALTADGWHVMGPAAVASAEGVDRLIYTLTRQSDSVGGWIASQP